MFICEYFFCTLTLIFAYFNFNWPCDLSCDCLPMHTRWRYTWRNWSPAICKSSSSIFIFKLNICLTQQLPFSCFGCSFKVHFHYISILQLLGVILWLYLNWQILTGVWCAWRVHHFFNFPLKHSYLLSSVPQAMQFSIWLCCEWLQHTCCQIDKDTFLIC